MNLLTKIDLDVIPYQKYRSKIEMELEYILEQTEEICLRAVRRDGSMLEHVRDQTLEICLEAVKQNGFALSYIKNQTEEMCLTAVRQDGDALEYVINKTEEIISEATRNGYQDFDEDEFMDRLFSDYEPVFDSLSPDVKGTITDLLQLHTDSIPRDCSICGEENSVRMGYTLMPCEHDSICIDCLCNLRQNTCPFCRKVIEDVIRTDL